LAAASVTGVITASALLWSGYAVAAVAVYLMTVLALAGTISCLVWRGRRA
jgi:hypothetical protein